MGRLYKSHLFKDARRCGTCAWQRTLRCERFHGVDFPGCRTIPGGDGSAESPIYLTAFWQNHIHVCAALHNQLMHQPLHLLRIPAQ